MKKLFISLNLIISVFIANSAFASDTSGSLTALQQHWAHANYELQGKVKEKEFEALLKEADQAVASDPQNAELLIWRGIIKSTYAGIEGGLGALKYVKSSKKDLETALEINASALDGSAYTSLGTLFYKVPGWPIAFGDDDKAEELLLKALSINPDGVDPNYFYADFLVQDGRYREALPYLKKALQAKARAGREVADAGRLAEVQSALREVEKKLN